MSIIFNAFTLLLIKQRAPWGMINSYQCVGQLLIRQKDESLGCEFFLKVLVNFTFFKAVRKVAKV